MKSKLLLYLLIAVAIVAVAAFVVYQLVYRTSNNVPVETGAGQAGLLPGATSQPFPSTGQPLPSSSAVGTFGASGTSASSSQFGIISNHPTLDYFVSVANIVTLIKPDGIIESIANNETNVLSSSTVPNIINAAFSYDGKKIFIAYRAGTTTQSSVFDLAARAWTHLPNGMLSPVWSPTNYQIAYLVPSNQGSETLMTIDAGTANAKPATLTSLTMEDMALQWPNKNTVIISDRPSAFTAGSVWLFDIPSKTLSSVSYENLGAESSWNASGSALLFSAGSNNAGGRLMFRDAAGNQKTLSFVTLPSKCVFEPPVAAASGTANPPVLVYCSVPSDQGTLLLARLPDEYDQNIYFTNDDFYRIDTGSGSLTRIFSSATINQTIDATRLKIFNNILFFVNRYDAKLYALVL